MDGKLDGKFTGLSRFSSLVLIPAGITAIFLLIGAAKALFSQLASAQVGKSCIHTAMASATFSSPEVDETKAREPLSLVNRVLRDPKIVIYKRKKQLQLFDGDELVKCYDVICGKNSGLKRKRGDGCTPEGKFYICVRNDKSRYYRSLGLSYPTPADARRGLKQGLIRKKDKEQIITAHRLQRQPTWQTALGGAIMIHGVAPGRSDTKGCIALVDNTAMKEIWDLIPLGSTVIIKP
ncbi:murein L,D-transpeptidase family protein [Planctomycetota bacterium]